MIICSVYISAQIVDILQVPPQIPALSERLLALLADEGPLTRVFAKVISKIARFLED